MGRTLQDVATELTVAWIQACAACSQQAPDPEAVIAFYNAAFSAAQRNQRKLSRLSAADTAT